MPRPQTKPYPQLLCVWCGKPIPDSRWGHGNPPKTCSDECRRARATQREKDRYHAAKHTEEWKSTRTAYIEDLKQRLKADPEFAEMVRERRIEYVRSSRANRDHERIEREREGGRRWYREFRKRLESDPTMLAQFQAKQRAWYHGLSQEEKARIYGEQRRRQVLTDLISTGEDLLKIAKEK